MRRGERGPDAAHVDDTLLRVRQLRDAMVGGAQLAPGVTVADGLTFPVPLGGSAVLRLGRHRESESNTWNRRRFKRGRRSLPL
jgi:hypothetical protein